MKKIILILIVLCVSLFILTACGGGDASDAAQDDSQGHTLAQIDPLPEPPTSPAPTTTTDTTAMDEAAVEDFTDNWSREPQTTIFQATPAIELTVTEVFTLAAAMEYLSNFEHIGTFAGNEEEFDNWLIFSANAPLNEFEFFGISHDYEGDSIIWVEDSLLFSKTKIAPGQAVLIRWINHGTLPHRGFSFLDENGVRRNFVFNTDNSISDNHLFFLEF